MSDDFFEPAQIAKLVKGARDTPIAFAFGVGSSADKNLLAAARQKSGEQLFAAVRKQGASRGFWGTVTFDGGVATFLTDGASPGHQKLLEGWAKLNRLGVKIMLTAPAEVAVPMKKAEQDPSQERKQDPSQERKQEPRQEPRQEPSGARPPARDELAREEKAEDEEDEEALARIFTPQEIDARLKDARKRPCFFAFGLGKTPDQHRLALHRRLPGERLAQMVKRENRATRLSSGAVSVEDKVATFTCLDDPISGMRNRLRALFKEWKLAYRIVVLGPDGRAEEADDEAQGTGDADAIAGRLAELLPGLKALAAKDPDRADGLKGAYRQCAGALSAGDLDAARSLLAGLEKIVAEISDSRDGVAAEATEDTFSARWNSVWSDYLEAQEKVDRQIAALQSALRGFDDPDLAKIAEFGLNALTGGMKVPLAVAARDLADAKPLVRSARAEKLLGRAAGFRAHLEEDERVAAVEANPFGVTVTIRDLLVARLAAIEAFAAKVA